jgi:hypothetical protein
MTENNAQKAFGPGFDPFIDLLDTAVLGASNAVRIPAPAPTTANSFPFTYGLAWPRTPAFDLM